LILGEKQYFCLGRRLSKHKVTSFAKNLGVRGPLGPVGYAYGCKENTFAINSTYSLIKNY